MKRNKLLKCIMTIVIAITVIALVPRNINAEELKKQNLNINLGEFDYTITDYVEGEVIVEKRSEDSVDIIDKETGVVLETITSKIIPKNSPELKLIITPQNAKSNNTSYYAIQRDKKDKLNTVRLEIMVLLYKSGSFSSVQSIEGKKMFLIASSRSKLEDVSTFARSVSGKFPSTNIEYRGSGVLTETTTKTSSTTISGGITFKELATMGYNYQFGTGSIVYLRKPIGIQGNFYTNSQAK